MAIDFQNGYKNALFSNYYIIEKLQFSPCVPKFTLSWIKLMYDLIMMIIINNIIF